MSATRPNVAVGLNGRLRQERLRLGWTQAMTAERAGISARALARFEQTGRTSLAHLLKLAAALGLAVELTAAPNAGIVPDPLAARTRQRGVRHAKPKTAKASARGNVARVTGAPPARTPPPATYRPVTLTEPLPAGDASAVAEVMKKHRDAIARLVGLIVRGRLTNWTAAQVTRNSMASNAVPESARPAYVAATLAQLAQLTAENIQAYGIAPADLEAWSNTWRPDEPIHGALD